LSTLDLNALNKLSISTTSNSKVTDWMNCCDPQMESRTQRRKKHTLHQVMEPDSNCNWCKQEETVE